MKLFMKTSGDGARYLQHNLSIIAVVIQTRAMSMARHKMKSELLKKLNL